MKTQVLCSLTYILLGFGGLSAAHPQSVGSAKNTQTRGIQWITSYEQAVNEAKKTGRPIALFFTGSDWCTWCKKLEQEALDTGEFSSLVNGKIIFVKLDFPMHHPLEPRLARQNQQLRDRYNINSYPTLLVVDAEGKKVGTTGYRQGGGRRFAQHLLSMVDSFSKQQDTIQELAGHDLSFDELKDLYVKAKKLGHHEDSRKILQQGLKKDKENFFVTEQYRYLVEEGEMHEKNTLRLRSQLLSLRDAKQLRKAHHDIAVIDFQALHHQMKRDHAHPAVAVAPLEDYLERYGNSDKENAWRMNMTISQVYMEQGHLQEALKYAENAKSNAPNSVKGDINKAISFIQHQLEQNHDS